MKLSLQLKLGQQLTMTPQLQQAIKLLQLSTLDLQQEIHQAIESNPMLEFVEESAEDDTPNGEADIPSKNDFDSNELSNASLMASSDEENSDWQEKIPADLEVDSHWEDIYQNTPTSKHTNEAEIIDYETKDTTTDSLREHLLWQLNLTPMSEKDLSVGYAIIDAIDSNGALTIEIETIYSDLKNDFDIELDEVVAVLHRIQQFDPIGVGYRDLTECLLTQLSQLNDNEQMQSVENAKNIIKEHMKLLANQDYSQLMRRTKLSEKEIRDAEGIIKTLDPRPGSNIAPLSTTYLVPDVVVSKETKSGQWKVELNPDMTPKIQINDNYAALVKRADSSDENNYLRNNLQEARWFIKSLLSRNETLMKVASRIVEHQKDFLEEGEEAMKPLVLHDIAEAVSMHESTISRVTTQKYMHTPRGIFELKYFFSSHVSTSDGGECSSTAIRAIIKRIISEENSRKPLSDNKITQVLEEKGINVARRTIAKYRESLSIPPSNERKRLS
tara:strand:- start:3490 stop:4989 length:1500 start_codon:yes stop_codon:yes gene_type:complete